MATKRLILLAVAAFMIVLSFSSAGDSTHWAIGLEVPCAISVRRTLNDGVAVEMTLPHTGPFRVVLRDAFSSLAIGDTHVRFTLGAGAAVAFLYKLPAWGSCGLMGVEIALGSLPAYLLAEVVVLLPWAPSVGGIGIVADVGFRWCFP